MENASKALIMAGSILIGIIIMSIMVYAFNSAGEFASSIDDIIEENEIYRFNHQFELFGNKSELTWYDVLTVINLANDINDKGTGLTVEVFVHPGPRQYAPIDPALGYEERKNLEDNLKADRKYQMESIEYGVDGTVSKVVFR